jgi:hypothetical protein
MLSVIGFGEDVLEFAGGTFDVHISDNYEDDLVRFTEHYPSLAQYTIDKVLLPPWKRPPKDDLK